MNESTRQKIILQISDLEMQLEETSRLREVDGQALEELNLIQGKMNRLFARAQSLARSIEMAWGPAAAF